MTMEQLAVRATAGDERGLNELLVRLGPRMEKLASGIRGADQDDLAQIGLVAVWRGLDQYDTSRPFMNWASTVARRAMLGAVRRRHNRQMAGFQDGLGLSVECGGEVDPITEGLPDWWYLEVCAGLSNAERSAISQRFGLLGRGGPSNTKDVADYHGMTRGQSSSRLKESLALVRVAFEVRYGGSV